METRDVMIENGKFTGFEVPLPKAPLVGVYNENGFVMCGFLNIEAADKMGIAAGMVRGVRTVDDLLKAPLQGVSEAGLAKGLKLGMTGREALLKLSQTST